jgi:hypothetical protein
VLTEIPEHLLQRSRERRAALGLGGGDAGATPAASPAADTPGAEVTPAAAAAAAPVRRAGPVEPEVKEPEPVPHYVEAAQRRHRIPVWALPVLAGLIFWAPIYIGTLDTPAAGGPIDAGREIYPISCGGCHGPGGGGGVGRQLSDGEVLLTFPTWQGHVDFVVLGTRGGYEGEIVGDPDRPGGPHIGGDFGIMPGFSTLLSSLEILEVVLYERVTHGGADMESDDIVSLLEAIEAVEGGAELDLTAAG